MLTFSRAAATEFKTRLIELIGNAANFVEIKTFHSYCFDLLGKIGSLDGVKEVIPKAVQMIESGEVEQGRITKTVLLIDEAQDMDKNEHALVRALMSRNEDMRVIAVGDDDQNIYEWRGSSSEYMRSFIDGFGARKYELTENYRSRKNIVELANEMVKTIHNRMKIIPISAVNPENGIVEITRHKSVNLEEPVVNKVIETYRGGKACVLTVTNEEALRVCTLLNKRGIRARLIQSLDGFRLSNLAEIRFFLKKIDAELKSSVISNEIWENAKRSLNEYFRGSECLENCNNLISDFEKTHTYSKYRTDLEEFINQSNYEDFYTDELDAVYVSTIHKAKGREFDNVYMLLNNFTSDGGAESRKLYVGMTRAKNELYIHCGNGIFEMFNIPDINKTYDEKMYTAPDEITLSLTLKDVVLSFFKGKKSLIFRLQSGIPLNVDGSYLTAVIDGEIQRVAKLSKGCVEKIEGLTSKGYSPVSAKVRFIVAWKEDTDEEESAVVLADLYMEK